MQWTSRSLFSPLLRPASASRWIKVALGSLALYALARYLGLTNLELLWFMKRDQQECGTAQHETIIGVYHAVDPCVYSDVYPESPNPKIKQVADLMTELYELFIEMQYLDKADVAFPPHMSPKIDVARAAKYGLTKDVVDLMQIVPYRTGGPNWNYGSDGGEFLMWGEFMDDMRQPDADWWQNIIDPFYAIDNLDPDSVFKDELRIAEIKDWDHEAGPYMRPWYATMTNCGNHGSVMVLNTKDYHIWLINQLGGSTDPFFESTNWQRQTRNQNDLKQYPSRPAQEFLEDMIARFRSLRWIPGGLYNDDYREYDGFKDIYIKAGWPDRFDPLLFDRLRNEKGEAETNLHRSFEPIKALDAIARSLKLRQVDRNRLREIASRLDRHDYSSEEERKNLIGQKTTLEHDQNVDRWAEGQNEIEKRLEEQKAELNLLLLREGRFSGMSDEDYTTAIKDEWFVDKIQHLESLLTDKDEGARLERLLAESKIKTGKVKEETWSAFVQDDPRSTILTTNQLRRIVNEDLSIKDIDTMVTEVLRVERERGYTRFS